jgi:prefoldin subunit 5
MNLSQDSDDLPTDPELGSPAVSEAAARSAAPELPSPAVDATAPAVTLGESKNEAASVAATHPSAPNIPSPAPEARSAIERPGARLSLIPFIPRQGAEAPPPIGAAYWRTAFEKRFQIGAVAAGLAVVGVGGFASLSYKAQQDQALVSQNSETQNLAETVKALKARLSAIDAAKHEDIVELRKSVAELKNGLAAARESNAAVAQFNTRAERLEHDGTTRREEIADLRKSVAELKTGLAAAHDSSAALSQFNARADRLDRDAATRNADLTARLEKLEKKVAAPAVASLPQPPAAAVLAKQPAPTPLPPVATNVSKETTASIAPARPPIRGWVVREVRGNVAVVEGPYGFREIGPGDTLPGAGHVERIEKRGALWAVVTDQGVINGAYGGGASRAGAYGAFNGGYGPEDEF